MYTHTHTHTHIYCIYIKNYIFFVANVFNALVL